MRAEVHGPCLAQIPITSIPSENAVLLVSTTIFLDLEKLVL